MARRLLPILAALSAATALVLSAPAGPANAAPPSPPNDNRADAQAVPVPGRVAGTTVGSTVQAGEGGICGQTAGSVWYRISVAANRGVVVSLTANGSLDAEVDVYLLQRSRLSFAACDQTDNNGQAAAEFRAGAGTYLVRVAEQAGSDSGTFTLSLVPGPPPVQPPGRPLAGGGTAGRLDRVLHVDAAYYLPLTATKPYVINLVHRRDACMGWQLFPPGTRSFLRTRPVLQSYCVGDALYVPPAGAGGRYTIRVLADRYVRVPQPFRLIAGRASNDDLAPGLPLPNLVPQKGIVNGRTLDVVDVYGFTTTRRSSLDLTLAGPRRHQLTLELRNDRGQQLGCSCFPGSRLALSRRLAPGRYYVAVRSVDQLRTPYSLTRRSRTITATRTRFDGRASETVRPKRAVAIGIAVTPAVSGTAQLTIQRFDPFHGWLPFTVRTVALRGGSAAVRWVPPSIGRWRASAAYAGARLFAPSGSTWAQLQVLDRPSAAARATLPRTTLTPTTLVPTTAR